MVDATVRKGNQLRLEGLSLEAEGLNPSAGTSFFSPKISVKVDFSHPFLIVHLFRVGEAILVQSSAVQCYYFQMNKKRLELGKQLKNRHQLIV